MIGSDLGNGLVNTAGSGIFGFNFGLNKGAGYTIGINPRIGLFVEDDFLLGAVLNFGFTKSPESSVISTEATTYGIQALSRYYLKPNEKGIDNLLDHGRFFLEANAGFAGVNIKQDDTTHGFIYGIGSEYSYFLNQRVAIEGALKYNGLIGGGNTTYQH